MHLNVQVGMRFVLQLLLALVLIQTATAHTLFSRLFIDGQDQGNDICIRIPHNPSTATDPIASLTSSDMACGVNGTQGVARVCAASYNSTLTFEYHAWPNNASDGSIDASHKGPCAVYLKRVASALGDPATGSGWFKIWAAGYSSSSGKWCTETIMANNGHLSVQLPEGLEQGYYLVRSELLALHDADKSPSDPQFYVGCAQLFLSSLGSALPVAADTVAIPGYVEQGQAALTFDIWTVPMALPYPLPGPAIFAPVLSPSAVTSLSQRPASQQDGLEPADCVLENANWCGIEVASYTTIDGCWNASADCWTQCTECYGTAPPTGYTNCAIWETKCMGIQQGCASASGRVEGPPGRGTILTPKKEECELPAAMPAQTGDGSVGAIVNGDSAVAAPYASSASLYYINNVASTLSTLVSSSAATTAGSVATLREDSAGASTAALARSTDGSCGGLSGETCSDSLFGECCSTAGYCGYTGAYCGVGCQIAYGVCGTWNQVRR